MAGLVNLSAAVPGAGRLRGDGRYRHRPRRSRPPEACFDAAPADSFSPPTERFVYPCTVGGRRYLLTLDGVYTYLPLATGITIANEFRTVCSGTRAMPEFMSFGRPVSCRIVAVDAVADKAAARRLAGDRAGRR